MTTKSRFLYAFVGRGKILAIALLVAACQPAPVVSTPPAEWLEPAPEPAAPHIPETATDDEADAIEADYIQRLYDWGRAANNRLARLKDWAAGVR